MGSHQDQKRRENHRIDTHVLQNKVAMTREWILDEGYKIQGAAVERVLSPESLVPTQVCEI
jgi:hypothetical protein